MRLGRKIPHQLDEFPVPFEFAVAYAIGIRDEWKTRHPKWVSCRDARGARRSQHGLSVDRPRADAAADLRKDVATRGAVNQSQALGADFPLIHHDALALNRFRICRSPD